MKNISMSQQSSSANRWRILGWTGVVLVLLVPLIAMQFTTEVQWTLGDFVAAGLLLGGAGLVLEVAARKTTSAAYKTALVIATGGAVLTVWVNGAVGIIGSEDHPANLMFFGVLAIGLATAVLVRFQPRGMVWAMWAMAAAQIAAFAAAWMAGWAFTGPATLFFLAFWLGAAHLFREAADEQADESA